MRFRPSSPSGTRRKYFLSFFLLASVTMSMAFVFRTADAAPPQLSLADILIALRSKKVTLAERNQILTGAVAERGITFVLTPEIEKELQGTGADNALIEAIRQKSTAAVASLAPKTAPTPAATPVPTPTPPDATFYKKRGSAYVAKGEYDLGVMDLDKVIAMKGDDAGTYLNRGIAYSGKNRTDLAIGDFTKAIEMDPTQSTAYFNRGNSYEKAGDTQKAVGDYQKALDLDANNEAARTSLQKLMPRPEPKPVAPPSSQPPAGVAAAAANTPGIVNVGQINNAVRLAVPVYPQIARQMNIGGRVVVQVTLDEEGKVVSAKATSGPVALRNASEDAARKSKFNPVLSGDKPVKAIGYVVFNFVS